jgi:cytochrome c553
MEAAIELEIKQKLSQLSDLDLRSISAYLLRLRQASEESKKERTIIMDEMDQGRKTRLSDLQLDQEAS